jgi:hypothetical protein
MISPVTRPTLAAGSDSYLSIYYVRSLRCAVRCEDTLAGAEADAPKGQSDSRQPEDAGPDIRCTTSFWPYRRAVALRGGGSRHYHYFLTQVRFLGH